MSYLFTDSASYLLRRIGVKVAETFSRRLVEKDVTIHMYRVMATLQQHGSQTLGALQDMVSIEMSTLSRLISAMAKRGIVSRVRSENNARTVIIDLTEEGNRLTKELIPLGAAFESRILDGLSGDDIKGLKRMLREIIDNVERLQKAQASLSDDEAAHDTVKISRIM